MILLMVDVQNMITNNKLYCFEKFVSNVKVLIRCARENNIEIVYVRHDDGAGELLEKGTEGFEIYDEFKPVSGEMNFEVKPCYPLEWSDESIDIITICCAFHHFDNPQGFVNECKRVLKKNGSVYIADPNFGAVLRAKA